MIFPTANHSFWLPSIHAPSFCEQDPIFLCNSTLMPNSWKMMKLTLSPPPREMLLLFRGCRFWLCNPMDCNPPGSSVHGILPRRILEWLSFPSPGDLPDPGIAPALAGRFFTPEPPGKPKRDAQDYSVI